MERPLDTIRSFNAAAEGTSSRRASYQRQRTFLDLARRVSKLTLTASQFNSWDTQSRRGSSYFGSPNSSYSTGFRGPPRGPGGYYNRTSSYGLRHEQAESEYHHSQNQGPGYPRHQRFQSAPMNMETQMSQVQTRNSLMPQHGHQQSYETMTTALSASGSDEMSKSTNPSSQNSSFDQLHQIGRKPDEYHNPYRANGGTTRGQYPPNAMLNNTNNQQWNGRPVDDYGIEFSNRPVPPPKSGFMNGAREVAPVNGEQDSTIDGRPVKRQSWLKRTFSRKGN